jgi:flagellar biosynthetic protein FliQ
MTTEWVLGIGREAIYMALMVSAPMLLLGLLVGLTVAIFQAVTQVHEMTLTFIPKILAVAAALLIFLPWMIAQLVDYTTRMITSVSGIS